MISNPHVIAGIRQDIVKWRLYDRLLHHDSRRILPLDWTILVAVGPSRTSIGPYPYCGWYNWDKYITTLNL